MRFPIYFYEPICTGIISGCVVLRCELYPVPIDLIHHSDYRGKELGREHQREAS